MLSFTVGFAAGYIVNQYSAAIVAYARKTFEALRKE